MKKLMMTAALLAVITVSAQRQGGRGFAKDLSVEEIATLKTKKMTLALALDQDQSDEVYTLVLDQEKNRRAQMEARKEEDRPKLTKEQRLEKMNERLDARIAAQNKMKAILTETQFEEYQKIAKRRGRKGKNGKGRPSRARK